MDKNKKLYIVIAVLATIIVVSLCGIGVYALIKNGSVSVSKSVPTVEYCPLDKAFKEDEIIMDFVYEFKDIAQSVLDNPSGINLYITDAELLANKINKQEVSPCLEQLKLALYNAVTSFRKSIFYLSAGDIDNYEKYLDESSGYIEEMHKELKIYENEVNK